MAAVYDYSVPFTLTSPFGGLPINQLVTSSGETLGYFLLVHAECESGASMRVSRDDVPQASGEIAHLHYKAGYEMRLKLQLWETIGDEGKPALRELLVDMGDLLQLHLNALVDDDPLRPLSIVADPLGLTRIQWTPWGGPVDRMLDRIRLLERPVFAPNGDNESLVEVTFALLSDRPYAMDAPQSKTCLGAPPAPDNGCSGPNPGTIVNGGTSPFYPVTRIYGPFNTFTLRNNSLLDENGQPTAIVYDAIGNPGGLSVGSGHYLEIDHWANTAYLDGHVANYKAGLTIPQSDFWFLQPGPNIIEVTGGYTGAGVSVLWQNAYA